MAIYDHSWQPVVIHGRTMSNPRNAMGDHGHNTGARGNPWSSMAIPRATMAIYGHPWDCHGQPSRQCHGRPWQPMALPWSPTVIDSWQFTVIHGHPWQPMTPSWPRMVIHGRPWDCFDGPWQPMTMPSPSMTAHAIVCHGLPRAIIAVPWVTMEDHGRP